MERKEVNMGRGKSKLSSGASLPNRTPTNEGGIHGSEQYGYMTDKGISELESLGFKRWSRYGKDRLYVTDKALEKIADLKMVLRRKGSIESATLEGDPISNSQAGKISAGMTGAYIDLNTMKVEYMPDSSHSASFYGVTTKVENEIKKRIYPTK